MKRLTLLALFLVGCGGSISGVDVDAGASEAVPSSPFNCWIDSAGECQCNVDTSTWDLQTLGALSEWCTHLKNSQ